MALTGDFETTVRARLKRDPAFRKALLREIDDCRRSEEVEIAESMLALLKDVPTVQKATRQKRSRCQS